MTEAEWFECDDPEVMLEFLSGKESERKLRLIANACCQCSRQLMLNKEHQLALEINARYVDGQATAEELAIAHQRAHEYSCGLYHTQTERENRRWAEATAVACALAGSATQAVWGIQRAARRDPNKRLIELIRDVTGNPFHLVLPGVSYWRQPELLREMFGNPLRPVAIDDLVLPGVIRHPSRGRVAQFHAAIFPV